MHAVSASAINQSYILSVRSPKYELLHLRKRHLRSQRRYRDGGILVLRPQYAEPLSYFQAYDYSTCNDGSDTQYFFIEKGNGVQWLATDDDPLQEKRFGCSTATKLRRPPSVFTQWWNSTRGSSCSTSETHSYKG